ncbi:MAG: hypothetical protein GY786_07050 [Proteobacteria bacterium]|nr:hypothetical protein [Pseudomonadota bacterium]
MISFKRHKVLRKKIPHLENRVVLLLFLVLLILVYWVGLQKNNYDPAERDLSLNQLQNQKKAIKLYSFPLKKWRDPTHPGKPENLNLGNFPQEILDQRWKTKRDVKIFSPDNLYEKINGEAPKFLRQGFKRLDYLELEMGNLEISIELYELTKEGGSMGLFSDHAQNSKKIEESSGVIYFLTSIGAIGRVDRFFFRLLGSRKDPEIDGKTQQILKAFSSLSTSGNSDTNPDRFLRDRFGLPAKAISFQKSNVFQLDFANEFWFGRLSPDNETTVFLHDSISEKKAADLFRNILEEQLYEHEKIDISESKAVLRHQFLKTYFVLVRDKQRLFGIEQLEDPDQIREILSRFIDEK